MIEIFLYDLGPETTEISRRLKGLLRQPVYREWIKENNIDAEIITGIARFKNSEDAIIFKLKFNL